MLMHGFLFFLKCLDKQSTVGHYLNQAIKLNPYWEVPYKIFADYNISQKKYPKAIQSLKTILKLNPNDSEARKKLLEIEELQQKETASALRDNQ
jgi:predicted TPR repeat methyltransferase